MNIGFTAPHFSPDVTGPSREELEVAFALTRLGYSMHVYTSTPSTVTGAETADMADIEVIRIPVVGGIMQFRVSLQFPRIMMEDRSDLIHVHEYRDYLGSVASFASRLRGRPYILQPHGSLLGYRQMLPRRSWKPYQLFDSATLRLVALKADRLVVETRQEFQEATDFGVSPERIRLIPSGVHATTDTGKEACDQVRFLFVGRIAPNRNVHDILRAFALANRPASSLLTIVGGEVMLSGTQKHGYLETLIQLAHSLGLAKSVNFVGVRHGRDLEKIYQNSDVFVSASTYESFGLPLLEAASYGLPVISTRVGVAPDIVRPGITGALFDAGDVRKLASIMAYMTDNRDVLPTMGKEIRSKVLSDYAWSKVVLMYKDLYDELAG